MDDKKFGTSSTVTINDVPFRIDRKLGPDLWEVTNLENDSVTTLRDEDVRSQLVLEGRLHEPQVANNEYFNAAEIRLFEELDEKAQERARLKLYFVQQVLQVFPSGTSPKKIEPLLPGLWRAFRGRRGHVEVSKATISAKGPNPHSVYRWCRTFLAGDRSIMALVDKHHAKGNRKPRMPEIRHIVAESIARVYMQLTRGTLKATLEDAMATIVRENHQRPATLQLPLPGERLVRSMVAKIPAVDKLVARHGPKAALQFARGGMRHYVATAPLEIVGMDDTRANVFVVDDITGLPLGCPIVTASTDTFSRSYHGFHMRYGGTQFGAVAACLKFGIRKKDHLQAVLGPKSRPWGCYGIPNRIVVDNALVHHGKALESACNELGITLAYCGRIRPWGKPQIERALGTINRNVSMITPGTTFSNIFEKGEYDPLKHAVMTKSELEKAMLHWITNIYHQEIHSVMHDAPARLWDRHTSGMYIRTEENLAKLDLLFSFPTTRSLFTYGIELNGLIYNSEELKEMYLILGPVKQLRVRYNPENLGYIYVQRLGGIGYIRVKAIQAAYATGLTAWQHKVIKRYARRKGILAGDPEGLLLAKQALREFVSHCLANQGLRLRTQAARFMDDDRRGERAAEAPLITQGQAVVVQHRPQVPVKSNLEETSSGPADGEEFSPRLRILSNLRRPHNG
ncbi:MAG TPA: Mu transposase C-terminal domain-containing protein [Gammaproteobacteria bacterium]